MDTAVMIGAGNIGRGFIGQILHDSGYEVVFVDVDRELVEALNRQGSYTLRLVDQRGERVLTIDRVRAVYGGDTARVAQELAGCALAATAVGKGALPHIVEGLAAGIRLRAGRPGAAPLNVLVCENLADAPAHLRGLLSPRFLGEEAALLEGVGLVETTIGRMVPAPTPQMRAEDVTQVVAEPFCALPVDRDAFLGDMPPIRYAEPHAPFRFCEEKKLYIHNMGHALCAYLGWLRGHEYIWQAVEDGAVAEVVRRAMYGLCAAIARRWGADPALLRDHADDLLGRFANRHLGDTVVRVGADPLRKLAAGDRFAGAITRCKKQGVDCGALYTGVAAALLYDHRPDPSAGELHRLLAEQGAAKLVGTHCGLSTEDGQAVEKEYRRLLAERTPGAG